MRTLRLTGLFILCGVIVNGQTTNLDNNLRNELIGIWGMFKDKHPDGWGSWNPPHEYLEFRADGKYYRTHLHKKESAIIFGTYEIVNDSLLIFHESVITDGIHKGLVKADTARLYSVKADLVEIWEDWDRILWKSVKKWGHKQKYRPLTKEETEKLEAVKNKLMNDYSLIKVTEENKDN